MKKGRNSDSLDLLAAQFYEDARDAWPLVIDPFASPTPREKPLPSSANPFQRPRRPPRPMKHSYLTSRDAEKVYDAMAYAMWKDGVILNTHVIIVWSMMGLSEVDGAEALGLYLNEARKWLLVDGGLRRLRRSGRSVLTKTNLRYVYVHENAPGRGFHSHVLINVPRALWKTFDQWSRSCLVRLAHRRFDRNALRVVKSYGKTTDDEVRNAWRWYRYIIKELHPSCVFTWKDHGVGKIIEMNSRAVLNPWRIREAIAVQKVKMSGVSRNIDREARKSDEFVSRLGRCEIDSLYAGREIDEGRWHRQEKAEYEELLKTLQI